MVRAGERLQAAGREALEISPFLGKEDEAKRLGRTHTGRI